MFVDQFPVFFPSYGIDMCLYLQFASCRNIEAGHGPEMLEISIFPGSVFVIGFRDYFIFASDRVVRIDDLYL